jgi:glycosyltransferase EpsE
VETRNPAISVIMAEFNTDPGHLEASVRSITTQTFDDFELIIVDDGGRNDLEELKARIGDSRIRIIHNGENRGFVYSLNLAIQAARAPLIVRMDTDDIAMNDRIEKLYKFMCDHPEFTVAASLAIEFSNETGNGHILGKPGEKGPKQLMHGDAPIHPAVIYRRSDVISEGMYDNYHRAEDLALWCKLVVAGKRIFVMDEILLNYRVNPGDFRKRTLKNRSGEIKARLHYYPALGASPFDYFHICRSIVAGILPTKLVISLRNLFVLGPKKEPGA